MNFKHWLMPHFLLMIDDQHREIGMIVKLASHESSDAIEAYN